MVLKVNIGVVVIQIGPNGEWKSGISSHLTEAEKQGITEILNVENGDLLFISAEEWKQSLITLGR